MIWAERPFPNSNFLLLDGEEPTLVDTGFVSHAHETVALAEEHTPQVKWVVNTHWHSDHVGANRLLQQNGTGIIGSSVDADSLDHAASDCCAAEYLDQPVPQYTIDLPIADGQTLRIGDGHWRVLAVPGHTPGHIALWNDELRVLAVGDSLSSYDVGWIDVMREGCAAIDQAMASLRRIQALEVDTIFPGHGPLISDPEPHLEKAIERLGKQRSDIDMAVDYGAKRILSFALVIRGGMAVSQLDDYLLQRPWVQDAAETVDRSPEEFSRELVDSMVRSGALVIRNGEVHPSIPAESADPSVFALSFPRDWNGS